MHHNCVRGNVQFLQVDKEVCIKLRLLSPFHSKSQSSSTSSNLQLFHVLITVSALTHITRIRRDFDAANSPRYRAGFAPMLFQWCYSHMARFSSRICCDFFTARFFRSRPLYIACFLFCRAIFHVQTDWALLFVLQQLHCCLFFPIDNTYETDAFQRFYRSCEFSNIAFGSISIYTPL